LIARFPKAFNLSTYFSKYFNDEGEHWCRKGKITKEDVEYWLGYNNEKYQGKIRIKQTIIRFFKDREIATLQPESIKKSWKN